METEPTYLTPEIQEKMDKIITENPKIHKTEIAKQLGIDPILLKDLCIKDRQEDLFKQAEEFLQSISKINIKEVGSYTKSQIQIMKIKQTQAMFILETLGKDFGYSKRNELTGKDGNEIRIASISFNPPIPNKKID